MAAVTFQQIKDTLRSLYLDEPCRWLVGFSGGEDKTPVAALEFKAALAIPPAERTKEIHVVCTDTREKIPSVIEAIETTLARMRNCAAEHDLRLELHLLHC